MLFHSNSLNMLDDETSQNEFNNDIPIKQQPILDYFDDEYEDNEEGKEICFKRYFGPIKAGSLRGAIISLASIVFGIGALPFPHAFSNMGLIPGCVLMLLFSFISYWTLCLLLQSGRKMREFNYSRLIKKCFGHNISRLIDINNILFCIGIIMSFEFTISTFFLDIFDNFYPLSKTNTSYLKVIQIATSVLFVLIPLSLLRNISKLQYVSIIGCITLLYTAVLIFIQAPLYYREGINKDRKLQLFKKPSLLYLDSFSVFLYGFAQHNGMFPIIAELKRPTKKRCFKVINRAFLLELVVLSIIGLSGYFSLLKETPSIFISRPDLPFTFMKMDYFMLASKILFFITLHVLCAIVNNILRTSLKAVFYNGKEIPKKNDVITVICLYLCTYLITYFIKDLLSILSILGGICAVVLSFVMPILCWIKTNSYEVTHWKNISALIVMCVTIVIGLCCVGYSIYCDIRGMI